MSLIDTHCHIYYDKYNNDFDKIIDRAKQNNISKLICVGVDMESSIQSVKLAEDYAIIYASVGFHPHESKDTNKNYLNELEELLSHNKVVALGETGLDFYYNHSNEKTQIRVFKEQLEFAKSLNMPAIVHCRNSDEKLLIKCFLTATGRLETVTLSPRFEISYVKNIFGPTTSTFTSFTGVL